MYLWVGTYIYYSHYSNIRLYLVVTFFALSLCIDTPWLFLGWPILFKFLGRFWKIKRWYLERKSRFLQPIQPTRNRISSSFGGVKINQYIWIIHERVKHGKIFQKRKFFKFIQFCQKLIHIRFGLWTVQKMVDAERYLWWRFSKFSIKGTHKWIILYYLYY